MFVYSGINKIPKFNKLVEEANVMQEVRRREYYEKPTTKRKRRKQEALKRQSRLNSENIMNQKRNRKY